MCIRDREETQRNWSYNFSREIIAPSSNFYKKNETKPTKTLFSHAPRGRGRGMVLARHASRAGMA